MVLEAGNSSLEYFIANEGPCIAKDMSAITIFKIEVVKRGVSHTEFSMLETCITNLARVQKNYCR